MEVVANAVFACACPPGKLVRIHAATTSIETVRRSPTPVWTIASGEGALWAITGYELDTIERIDPKANAVVETFPLGQIGESSGWRYRMTVGAGAVWLLAPASLWRIDSTTKRVVGSVPLDRREEGGTIATGEGAVWITTSDGIVLRVDPDSQRVAKTIPLGTLMYPDPWDSMAVGYGSVWVAVTSLAS
jgi:hypothetical protein